MKIKQYIFLIPALIFLAACSSDTETVKTKKPAVNHYQLMTIGQSAIASTIKLPAQLMAYQEVSIFPKVNGYVKSVNVDIGSRVHKNQLLMQLEAPELEQASVQAHEKFERSKSDFAYARENFDRLKQASLTAGAISPLELTAAKTKMEADSLLSNSEKLNWQMQETIHGYLRVTAPFAGVITERNVHPGALVSAEAKDARPMLELKQMAALRLVVDIPELLAAGIHEKDSVTFYLSAFPGQEMKGRVSRKSMNVNLQYRTERVEVDVPNKKMLMAPGMYADLLLHVNGDNKAFSIPQSAVVTSTERKYIMVVRDGKIKKIDIITGNQSADQVAVTGSLKAGDQVVIHADDEIADGEPVQ